MNVLSKMQLILSNIRFRWLALAALLTLSLAACHSHHHHGAAHHEKMIEKGVSVVSHKLDFDQQQKQMLTDLATEVMQIRTETKALHQDRQAVFSEMLNAEALDSAKLEAIIEEHRQQFDLFFPRILPQIEKLHATLSDEQKEKIEKGVRKRYRKHHSG